MGCLRRVDANPEAATTVRTTGRPHVPTWNVSKRFRGSAKHGVLRGGRFRWARSGPRPYGRSEDQGARMSDPALVEEGVIRHHPGIQGVDDLDPEVHGWTSPAMRITVERIG